MEQIMGTKTLETTMGTMSTTIAGTLGMTTLVSSAILGMLTLALTVELSTMEKIMEMKTLETTMGTMSTTTTKRLQTLDITLGSVTMEATMQLTTLETTMGITPSATAMVFKTMVITMGIITIATTTILATTTSVTVPTTISTISLPTPPVTSITTATTGNESSTIKENEQDCACNGEIDANNLGKCTKEAVWCYVDPDSGCNDFDEWTGEFGYGWTMSYEAFEAQLSTQFAGECNAAEKAKPNLPNSGKKECSCNGVLDSNKGGECIKPWVGNFWCYVDAESGCLDSQVWFGEFGFCQTYSFQACGFTNTTSVVEFNNMENTSTSTVPYDVSTDLTPDMIILGEECSCSGVIDDA